MIIVSALISVDTFLVLSGLLVSINLLKHFEKTYEHTQKEVKQSCSSFEFHMICLFQNSLFRKGRINIPKLYLHRFLRLTPLLGVSILFSLSLLRFMGNGPIWPRMLDRLSKQCELYWWSALLYTQNYVNPRNMVGINRFGIFYNNILFCFSFIINLSVDFIFKCFIHSWYLSVDMQLFLISPLIVYLIYRFNMKALLVMVSLVLGCIGCTIAIFLKYGINGR